MTEIREGAKIELLRNLLEWRDVLIPALHGAGVEHPSTHPALGGHEMDPQDAWRNPWDEVILAAKECATVGLIELLDRDKYEPEDWGVAITEAGADWITAFDFIGEIQQDPRPSQERAP